MTPESKRLMLKTMCATAALLALLGALGGIVVLKGGWYSVAATVPHFQATHSLLEQALHDSVRHHARRITAPALAQPQRIVRGAAVYREHCVHCHGGPGVSPATFGKSMQPVPGPLVDAARHWKSRELYWIVRHGIKMSGMPAWEFHLTEEDIWSVVAFLTKLPELTPEAYAQMTAVEAR